MSDAPPVFAVLGHPNEGKSSVVSTLTEDDTIPVSITPGETRACRAYPVMLDGREVMRFVDTPGFQVPHRTLRWFESYRGDDRRLLPDFIAAHADRGRFREDCELLRPVAEGACIIYVVDGSRPVRETDLAEMEILRRTGRPRLALINAKDPDEDHVDDWKRAFAKTFNVIRVFNAHRASYRERLELLAALKAIEQSWGERIQSVIDAFSRAWDARIETAAEEILDGLEAMLAKRVRGASTAVNRAAMDARTRELTEAYVEALSALERDCHRRLRRLFKHNIFRADLPRQTVLREDLFAEEVWWALGLTRRQLTAAMALLGAGVGVGIDAALAELTFGVFTAAGAVAGGLTGLGAARPLARLRVRVGPFSGKLGGRGITVGPLRNPQLMFIFLDRAILYYSYVRNWAHAKRDAPDEVPSEGRFTSRWPEARRRLFMRFFSAARSAGSARRDRLRADAQRALAETLREV
jgi:GTP-binding protein EngB required for normal cell division